MRGECPNRRSASPRRRLQRQPFGGERRIQCVQQHRRDKYRPESRFLARHGFDLGAHQFAESWADFSIGLWRKLYFALGWKDAYGENSEAVIDHFKKAVLHTLKVDESFLTEGEAEA